MNFSKILSILSTRRKRQLPIVIVAMFLGAMFEVLGISLIIPMMDIITGSSNAVTNFLKVNIRIIDDKYIALFSISLFALIYFLKGVYLSGLAWFTAQFSFGVKADISNTLIEKYLLVPYEFHLEKNSAQLIRNLTTEATQVVLHAVIPLLIVISEGFVIASITIFLFLVEPQGTIIVILFLIILSYAFQRFLGAYLKRLGKVRQDADGLIIQISQEALGGIKDVKVLGKEIQFYKHFRKYNELSANASAKQFSFSQIPRMYLETIGVLAFSIMIVYMLLKGGDVSRIFPILGVFALAAFRLLPSTNRILSAMNSLRYATSVILNLHTELTAVTAKDLKDNDFSSIRNNQLKFLNSIEIKDVFYRYPTSHDFALSGINLIIKKGESIGIVGKSGSGKSTLSDLILGLLCPSAGSISIDGANIQHNLKEWQALIGYVQQDIFLLDDTIERNIAFGELDGEIDSNKIQDVINEAELKEFITNLPDGIATQLGERGVRLSGGQRQRIGIARALYRNAPILIFDEATSALDNETESEIVSAIKRLQGTRTMIVIAHRLSTIEHCDRVVELHNGRIYSIDDSGI